MVFHAEKAKRHLFASLMLHFIEIPRPSFRGHQFFGRSFVKRLALSYRTVFPVCLSYLSLCNVGVLWPNGLMDQDETSRASRPRPRPRVRWGLSSPKGAQRPIFGPFPLWPMAGWIKMPLGMEVGLGPVDFVLDGDPAPPKKGTAPNYLPMSVVAKRLDGSRCHLVRR